MKSSNYIAGQWVEGTGSFNNINPSDTSDQIDSYTSATAEQFEQAVQAAIIVSACGIGEPNAPKRSVDKALPKRKTKRNKA